MGISVLLTISSILHRISGTKKMYKMIGSPNKGHGSHFNFSTWFRFL